MASRAYCEHVGPELEIWSKRLHDLSGKIDRLPTIDKQNLFPQIEELHIIMTELDDRLHDMSTSCSIIEENGDLVNDDRYPSGYSADHSNLKKDVNFDYDFGG
ncbi:MAG: hypothetical protein OEL55_04055 [Desulfobulbaceae bacterium]|nr:hypothetical protein [Desulfobulbaceae bacterium]